MAVVQDYIDFAVSMKIGNRAMTDISLSLPDDFRRFSGVKVESFNMDSLIGVVAGIPTAITLKDVNESMFMVFFSHPVSITEINGSTIADTFFTSFVAFSRMGAGTSSFNANILKFHNNLHTPTYTSDLGGSTTNVDVYIFHAKLVT
jgi:hypothetical protein